MAFITPTPVQTKTTTTVFEPNPKQQDKKKPLFPTHVFPASIVEFSAKAVEARRFAADYLGMAILYSTSLAIGNSLRSGLEPERAMPCSVYLVIVGESGANKSEPLRLALSPITEYDNKLFETYQKDLRAYNNRAKGEAIAKPILQSIISTDITYETILKRMKNNGKSFGASFDELKMLFGNANRYNGTDVEPFLLEVWNGGTFKKDRTSDENSILLKNAFFSLIGGIQKGGVSKFFTADRLDSGFTQRCLFGNPDTKPQIWSSDKIDLNQMNVYKNAIQKLLNLTYNPLEPLRFVPLSKEADKLVRQWQEDSIKHRIGDISRFEKSMLAKMDYYVFRLSLILQGLCFACDTDTIEFISEKSMQGAIDLVNYFSTHALSVFDLIDNSSPLDAMPTYKKHFYEALPDNFQRKDILNLANKYAVKKTTLARLLANDELFRVSSYGNYEKLF